MNGLRFAKARSARTGESLRQVKPSDPSAGATEGEERKAL